MSGDLPPNGPPSGPPGFGPPAGPPPSGPPPAGPPPAGPPPGFPGAVEPTQGPWGAPPPQQPPTYGYAQPAPEFLESGGGAPLPPTGPPTKGGSGKRKAIIAGAVVVGLGALAGGAFAAYTFINGSGPQPAEALPDSTVAYLSLDLDPSNKQKLEAVDTLRKFPGFSDNVDISGSDDLREKFFTMIQDEGECTNLDYSDDIEPWLGDRLGVAGVDLGAKDDNGDATVTPVVVVQVKDANAANDGLQKLTTCESGSSDDSASSDGSESTTSEDDFGGWAIRGEWAVIAESEDIAKQVSDAAVENPLSDDDSYQKWTDEAGGDGIATAYVSKRVVDFLPQVLSAVSGPACYATSTSVDDFGSDSTGDYCDESTSASADQLKEVLKDFDGLAVKVRFNDGAIEVESAGSLGEIGVTGASVSDKGGEVLQTLPADTAIAYGIGFEPGWFQAFTDNLSSFGPDMDMVNEALDQFEQESGLSLPEDVETLAGESAVVSLGSDFDVNNVESPGDVPFGVKIKGDPEAINSVIDKILAGDGVPPEVDEFVGRDTDGDLIAIGPNADYRQSILQDGDLGDSDEFKDLVPEADKSSVIMYVNFNANDWLAKAVRDSGAPAEVVDNVEPLAGLGISSWTDGDVAHGLIRITTD